MRRALIAVTVITILGVAGWFALHWVPAGGIYGLAASTGWRQSSRPLRRTTRCWPHGSERNREYSRRSRTASGLGIGGGSRSYSESPATVGGPRYRTWTTPRRGSGMVVQPGRSATCRRERDSPNKALQRTAATVCGLPGREGGADAVAAVFVISLRFVVIVQAPWGDGNGVAVVTAYVITPTACMDSFGLEEGP